MKLSVIIIIAGLLQCWIHLSQQNMVQICDDIIRGNAQKYSLAEINECANEQAYSNTRHAAAVLDCPQVDCSSGNCMFGFKKDKDGCPTCDCLLDGKKRLYEADIVLTDETMRYLTRNKQKTNHARIARGAAKSIALWNLYKEGDYYVVPYVIQGSVDSSTRSAIRAAVDDFAKETCIRLRPRTNQASYISFFRGGGCYSPVGRTTAYPSVNQISLGNGCGFKGTAIHEILHSLGFWHEQSRPDRDNYVTIQWNNIQSGLGYNFNKLSNQQIDSRNSPYDIGSLMHYSSSAFSSNGRPTITDKYGNRLKTQRFQFAATDIDQLNSMYGCKKSGSGGGGTTATTSTTQTPTTTAGSCKNSHRYCSYWAGTGECTKNPRYMLTSCCQSCSKQSSCQNRNKYCESWKTSGYCTSSMYRVYMKTNCAKSCNQCSNTGK